MRRRLSKTEVEEKRNQKLKIESADWSEIESNLFTIMMYKCINCIKCNLLFRLCAVPALHIESLSQNVCMCEVSELTSEYRIVQAKWKFQHLIWYFDGIGNWTIQNGWESRIECKATKEICSNNLLWCKAYGMQYERLANTKSSDFIIEYELHRFFSPCLLLFVSKIETPNGLNKKEVIWWSDLWRKQEKKIIHIFLCKWFRCLDPYTFAGYQKLLLDVTKSNHFAYDEH